MSTKLILGLYPTLRGFYPDLLMLRMRVYIKVIVPYPVLHVVSKFSLFECTAFLLRSNPQVDTHHNTLLASVASDALALAGSSVTIDHAEVVCGE